MHLHPARSLAAGGTVVEPVSTLADPAGHHVAARVEAVDRPVNAQLRRGRVRAVLVAPPPAKRAGDPAARAGLVGADLVGADGEGNLEGRVVVGAGVVVAAHGLDRARRGAREASRPIRVGHVHSVGLQRHRVTLEGAVARAGRDLTLTDEESRRGHRTGHRHADGDAPGDTLPRQRLPRGAVGRVLDAADDGLRLIPQHRVQRVGQARTPVLVALHGLQAVPVRRIARLLLRQGNDLLGVHLRVDLAQRRDDSGRQGRRLRRAVQVAVGLAVPARQRSVDLRAGGSEVDAARTPVRPGRRLEHAGGGVSALGQLQSGHRERAAQHRRHVDAALHVALIRAPGVARRRIVGGRRVIQVRRPVAGGHHVDDVLRGRVVDRALHGLQASGLLGVVRHPVLPWVDVVRAIGHGNAVVGGPHEAARDVLGVEESAIARGHVDRGDAQGRVHAVHAHAVVLRGDRSGDVRTVGRVVPAPRVGVAVGHAVDVAGHGLVVVDLSGQVRHGVIHGLVHDAHRHGGAHDVHVLRLKGVQGLEVPSVARLRVRGQGRVLIALSPLSSLGAGCGRERRVRRDSGLVGDGDHGLVAADGCLAGRADRVVADAFLHERGARVGREGGRGGLHEERAEGRVLGQDQAAQERGLGRGALEGGVIGALGQVDRVVGGQLLGGARGGGDAGLGGASGRGRRVGRGRRLRRGVRVARDGEDGLAARVVVGLAVEVDTGGAHLNARGHGVGALGQE